MEIAQKREALENVLIPYRMRENEAMLHRNGFRYIDIFYKWYNFYGIIAVKMCRFQAFAGDVRVIIIN